jgi:hypothetical protein
MTMLELRIYISHSQILVFDATMERPFNDWTRQHTKQGFSWRPGSVSFSTVDGDGDALVEVIVADNSIDLPLEAVRVIDVPFIVPSNGSIEVCSITGGELVDLAPGPYQLRFESHGLLADGRQKIKLIFWPSSNAIFKVARADAELDLRDGLLLTTTAA